MSELEDLRAEVLRLDEALREARAITERRLDAAEAWMERAEVAEAKVAAVEALVEEWTA